MPRSLHQMFIPKCPSVLYFPVLHGERGEIFAKECWTSSEFLDVANNDPEFACMSRNSKRHISLMLDYCMNEKNELPADYGALLKTLGLDKEKKYHPVYKWLYLPEFIDLGEILFSMYMRHSPIYPDHCPDCASNDR